MMLAPNGEKLSKRHGAVSVDEYRNMGYTPMAVLNYLVRFGWSYGDEEIFSREDLIQKFDFGSVGKSDGKFDPKKFADVAFEHLKRPDLTPIRRYASMVAPVSGRDRHRRPRRGQAPARHPHRSRARSHPAQTPRTRCTYFFRPPGLRREGQEEVPDARKRRDGSASSPTCSRRSRRGTRCTSRPR